MVKVFSWPTAFPGPLNWRVNRECMLVLEAGMLGWIGGGTVKEKGIGSGKKGDHSR